MARVTKAESALRADKVAELLLGGASRSQILQYAATTWSLHQRQADTYIAKAYRAIAAEATFDRDREVGRALLRLHFLFQAGMKLKDFRLARDANRDTIDLLGLRAPARIAVTTTADTANGHGAEDLDRMTIGDLLARRRELERLAHGGNGGADLGGPGNGGTTDAGPKH